MDSNTMAVNFYMSQVTSSGSKVGGKSSIRPSARYCFQVPERFGCSIGDTCPDSARASGCILCIHRRFPHALPFFRHSGISAAYAIPLHWRMFADRRLPRPDHPFAEWGHSRLVRMQPGGAQDLPCCRVPAQSECRAGSYLRRHVRDRAKMHTQANRCW
jgi:hypothetical protein